jgi:hypothetical protein
VKQIFNDNLKYIIIFLKICFNLAESRESVNSDEFIPVSNQNSFRKQTKENSTEVTNAQFSYVSLKSTHDASPERQKSGKSVKSGKSSVMSTESQYIESNSKI